jgi:hypothetical protein
LVSSVSSASTANAPLVHSASTSFKRGRTWVAKACDASSIGVGLWRLAAGQQSYARARLAVALVIGL